MRRRRSGSFLAAVVLATAASAHADGIAGPALIAWAPRYNQDHPELPTHGADCLNAPDHMPIDRRRHCERPHLESLEVGRYEISIANGAPFPSLLNDSGSLLFIAAVGSNAHCFEEETSDDTHDLTSIVRCVAPDSGENVDTTFDWTYRTDSTNFPQDARYVENFAYAIVYRDGSVDVNASFNPMALRDDDVVAERTESGKYTVTFRDLNPGDAMLDPVLEPYSAIVQKTCEGDLAGGAAADGCFRTVCSVSEVSPGTFEQRDSVVHVSCTAQDGSPRDTAFRLFFGQEAFTSQGSWEGGFRYGTVTYEDVSGELACLEGDALSSTSQHETPLSHYPGLPVRVCRTAVGVYDVDFLGDTITPYSIDGPNFALATLGTGATYCNVQRSLCGNTSLCGLPDGPDKTRITLQCFDPMGALVDAAWNFNVTY